MPDGLFATDAPAAIHLTAPVDYQVQQRDTPGFGRIVLAGELSQALGQSEPIMARLIGPDSGGTWLKVADIDPPERSFRHPWRVPAGGWYRLEVRLGDQESGICQASVEHVGIGEVFVVAGQSNAANHGAARQRTRTGRVSTFTGRDWTLTEDPQPGASGNGGSFLPSFGDLMVERFRVPIGLVATAVGATSVREWLPKGVTFTRLPTLTNRVAALPTGAYESDGQLFQALVQRSRAFGPLGFRAILWHQGESDANQPDPARTLPGAEYRQDLERLIREVRRELGWPVPWFVAQASYHTPKDPGSAEIREAQAAVWKDGVGFPGPNTDLLQGNLRSENGQGVHFSAEGLRAHAAAWVSRVAPWLEEQLIDAETNNQAEPVPSKIPPRATSLPLK